MQNIIKISDINIPELNIYSSYSENQLLHINEPDLGLFIAESPIVIERAFDAGYEPVSILMEDKHVDTQGKAVLERCEGLPVYAAPFDVLTQLTGYKLTRGMLCAFRRKKTIGMREILEGACRVAVMEDVVNPTNVGAVFRSAAALNMDAVILTRACCDPLYRRAIRVSMGNVFLIPWTYVDDDISWPEEGIRLLNEYGYKTVAMALGEDSLRVDDPELKKEKKLAVILGTEGQGLKEETIKACDYTVKIPMAYGVDSLNVAAASAVAFWEFGKKDCLKK